MYNNKAHIAFICSRLDVPGGIERAIVNLANLLTENGVKVTIIVTDNIQQIFYPLNSNITLFHRSLNFGITKEGNRITKKLKLLNDILTLKSVFKKCKADVFIGTEPSISIASWFAARLINKKVFAWEHHHFYWLEKNNFWSFLFGKVYPRLAMVVCNNSTEQKLFNDIGCKTIVIPNVVPNKNNPVSSLMSKELLTIGWLIRRKGVDLIPSIATKIQQKHPDWRWKIIGTGEEEEKFVNEIQKRNLQSFIEVVPPYTHDLTDEYLNSSVYIMTSRSECLPMVLLESMSYGIPCVSFDCPTGPAEIITDSKDGFIIPMDDIELIASKVNLLIENENLRKQLGAEAKKSSARYSPENIYKKWVQLFIEQNIIK